MLKISRGHYYYQKARPDSEITAEEIAVINCFEKHNGNYGRIRIRQELLLNGFDVSEHRISRMLKKYGKVAKRGVKRKKKSPKPTEKQYVEENLVKNKFEVTEPNYLWCSDITELKYKGNRLYVCCIIDVATRRIVGWAVGKRQTQDLVHTAFLMAVGRNPNRPEGAVYHSDRGCQYTAKKTKELVEEYGFRKSMSRPGRPNDNQPIESFWNTLECEMPSIRNMTFSQAKTEIARYIEMYYNSSRLHSGIGYMVPNEKFTVSTV